MSGPYTRDSREVIVDRSSRNSSPTAIIAIVILAIVIVGFAIIMFNQPGSRGGTPAGGGGTTTEQPKDNPTPAAPSEAAPAAS
jgi:hypothetical protein